MDYTASMFPTKVCAAICGDLVPMTLDIQLFVQSLLQAVYKRLRGVNNPNHETVAPSSPILEKFIAYKSHSFSHTCYKNGGPIRSSIFNLRLGNNLGFEDLCGIFDLPVVLIAALP
jgi:hypothetical protein